MEPTPGKVGRPVDSRKDLDIIKAARDLVHTHGSQGLTMEKVAERAGVAKATLYSRYANRHELLQAILSTEAMTIYTLLSRHPNTREELCSGLCSFIEAAKKFLCSKQYQHLLQAMGSLPEGSLDTLEFYRNGPQKTQDVLTAYLRSATLGGLIRCDDPEESAEMLLGMMMGLDQLRSAYRVPRPRRGAEARKHQAERITAAFMLIHAELERAGVPTLSCSGESMPS